MSIADFSGRLRPDACPGALQTHAAADGPLARIRLPGGAITPAQLHELAAFATSGIELTSRANVQVRALKSPALFADRMAAVGLLPSPTHERVRNIVASPLGGRLTGFATHPLVEALDRALCARPALAELPGRFLFALDDGTGDVSSLGADVTLVEDGILLAGTPFALPGAGVDTLVAVAEAFLAERGDSGAWRIAELPNGPTRIATHLAATGLPAPAPGLQAPGLQAPGLQAPGLTAAGLGADRAGAAAGASPVRGARVIGLPDGRVAVEAVVPLGRLTAAQARLLAALDVPVRLTPWRTVVLLDLAEAPDLTGSGLVTDPDSPWTGVSACTGSPGCAKSLADVQHDAAQWVAARERSPELPVHWAGCERRCGLPKGRVTEMVATGDGYQERQK
ncbi:precorrin-3B synthase [Nonomuraea endophytica]|uniref:Precorrin-3B synthase n=1 Tax=Nonomuraea endophytica TaxID=714136 RepID=A0A7W8ACQ2_9ACTN|nr:precorrin-3B synthase [Nonomuraea endophytica]MBB5082671.1 precorrin-3B synthase [Nonomuraea endophytica]